MKLAVTRIVPIFLVTVIFIGCSNNFFTTSSSTSNPAYSGKEILINNERYDKPYETLGPVEYTLKKDTSIFVTQIELRNLAIDNLKQEAKAKYGDEVDAIVDFKVVENSQESYDAKLSIIHVQGIAIAFIPEIKPIAKHKPKYKAKSTSSRAKSSKGGNSKNQTEDIEITPSELLK
jgi:hypothetical protein